MLLSLIDNNDIFMELFGLRIDLGLRAVAGLTSALGYGIQMDPRCVEKCFHILGRDALCRYKMSQWSYSIDRAVHDWAYARVRGDGADAIRLWTAASKLLDGYVRGIGRRPDDLGSRLRVEPHVMSNLRKFEQVSKVFDWDYVDSLPELDGLGSFLVNLGSHQIYDPSKSWILADHDY